MGSSNTAVGIGHGHWPCRPKQRENFPQKNGLVSQNARVTRAREQAQTRVWGVYLDIILIAALHNERASGFTQTAVERRPGD